MSEADKNLDLLIERLADTEREEYERGLGNDVLAAIAGADRRKEEQNRALLDILHRTGQPTESGDDAA